MNRFKSMPAVLEDCLSDLTKSVLAVLRQQGYVRHLELAVTGLQGTVVVEGGLPSYYLRQNAVACIKRVPGVLRVIDRIEVCRLPFQDPPKLRSVTDAE